MNQRVYDSSHCEYASDDGTDIDQELEDVLLRVRVVDGDWRDLIVKYDQIFCVAIVCLVRRCQLERFCDEGISECVI